MAEQGWIKLWRDIRDKWIWTTEKPFDQRSAWLDLIMMANRESKKIPFDGQVEEIMRGSFITSQAKLAEEWGWSRSKVARFLDLLESDHMIERSSNNKRTAVTIVNYNKYQDSRTTSEQRKTGFSQKTGQHSEQNPDSQRAAENVDTQGVCAIPRTALRTASEQPADIKRTSSGHKQEVIEDIRRKEGACASDSDEWTPPPKGTPEYDAWRNQ